MTTLRAMPVLFEDWLKLLRSRWITVCVVFVVTVLGAIAITWQTTPLYKATTRLFVSTSPAPGEEDYLSELYAGSAFSEERVLSYTALLQGETLNQRTVEKLGPEFSDMRAAVNASAESGTVLIDVNVVDESPIRARDFANALSEEFVIFVDELETRNGAKRQLAGVIVEQRAKISEKPVVPKEGRNLAIGVLLGLILGIGLAILRELFDKTVRDSRSLEMITGAPHIGNIPFEKNRKKEPAAAFDSEDDSVTAEAFRKLRTRVQFLSTPNRPHMIVVVSPMPSEGKSTTTINLALALVEAGHRVLLLDADMRRPTIAKYLNMVGSAGLSAVLNDQASLDEVLQQTSFPGLTVLAAGDTPSNPSELLGSTAAKQLFRDVRARFDYVIVNSPPLLAVTDATVLAVNADGVLLIARFGKTKRAQLAHATRNLTGVGASVFGTLLTMVPLKDEPHTYHYGYVAEQRPSGESPDEPVAVNPSPQSLGGGRHRLARPNPDQGTGADQLDSVDSGAFNELSARDGNSSEARIHAARSATLSEFESNLRRTRSRETLIGLTPIPETLDRLKFALDSPRVHGPRLGILICGIDDFEAINDHWGRALSEIVFTTLAMRIRQVVRQGDTVGRLRRDAVLLLLPGVHSLDNVTMVAEKILGRAEEPVCHSDLAIQATLSIGATLAVPGESESALRVRVEAAMDAAKLDGGNECRSVPAPARLG